jgi:hypothetical protein
MFGIVYIDDSPEVFSGNYSDYPNLSRLTGPAVLEYRGKDMTYPMMYNIMKCEHPFNVFRKQYKLSKHYNKWSDDMKVLFKLTYA